MPGTTIGVVMLTLVSTKAEGGEQVTVATHLRISKTIRSPGHP
jgi:hypothetical protein